MLSKISPIIVFFFLLPVVLPAQQVSTLVNDSSREFAAMHWHEDGRIYSVDYFNGRVYQVFLDGTVETLVSGFTNLSGGGFDNAGNFYFSGINQGIIYRLNADNTYTEVSSGFNQPVGLRASATDDDTMYVSEYGNSKVTKFSLSSGEKTPFVTGNGINGPDAIQYDWEGDLLVSNWNNHRIHTIDEAGVVSFFAELPDSGFMGYVDRVGDFLYVPSFTGKRVYRVNQDGELTLIAGTGASGSMDGPGATATFTRPNGTCHNPAGDTLLVSDDHRIRIITGLEPLVNTEERLELAEFKISPNPANEVLRLSFNWPTNDSLEWMIYDQQGRRVQQGAYPTLSTGTNNWELPINQLPAGNYTLQLLDSAKRTASYSFVKIGE